MVFSGGFFSQFLVFFFAAFCVFILAVFNNFLQFFVVLSGLSVFFKQFLAVFSFL